MAALHHRTFMAMAVRRTDHEPAGRRDRAHADGITMQRGSSTSTATVSAGRRLIMAAHGDALHRLGQ